MLGQEFLNQVATDIIEISHSKLVYYTGQQGEVWDVYKRSSASRRKELARQAQQAQQAEQAAGNTSKGHKGRNQRAEEDTVLAGPSGVYKVCFPLPQPPPLPLPIIAVDDIEFSYSGATEQLFSGLSTAVTLDSRIALVGKNGSGKSTLFKLLTRELVPTKGEVKFNPRLKIAVYNQHFIDQLPMEIPATQYLTELFPEVMLHDTRKALGMFGLADHAHEIKIKSLSGISVYLLLDREYVCTRSEVFERIQGVRRHV